VFFLAEY